ncbi:MAG: phosphoribosyltransferase [Anaerolineae bacterium]
MFEQPAVKEREHSENGAHEKEYLGWGQIEGLVDRLLEQLPRDYDVLMAVTRGGLVPAGLIAEKINQRNVMVAAVMFYTGEGETLDEPHFLQFPSDALLNRKRVLVIDDIWDSGRTAMGVKERIEVAGGEAEVAVLHYKPEHSVFEERPDYYVVETDRWIVYPWEPAEDQA